MDEFVHIVRDAEPRSADCEAVVLDYSRREKTRQRVQLESGEEIAIKVPRGTVMRGGDRLGGATGRTIRVIARAEPVSTVHTHDHEALARVAYHLGNRHVWLQVGPGWVRYLADHVLDDMVRGLGLEPVAELAPFEPEAGAYSVHSHQHA
jgi:urease accessory protein